MKYFMVMDLLKYTTQVTTTDRIQESRDNTDYERTSYDCIGDTYNK